MNDRYRPKADIRLETLSEVFKLNKKVKFSIELVMDDVFPGSILSPPDHNAPSSNIYDFPFDKDFAVIEHDPHTLAVHDSETDTYWGIMYFGLTTPTLIEIND